MGTKRITANMEPETLLKSTKCCTNKQIKANRHQSNECHTEVRSGDPQN